MAASDNLMTMEPWAFRSAFADSWFPDVFSRETQSTLTKLLQKSLSTQKPETTPVQTSTGSGRTVSGGSENETISGKISKRKSRASRRNTTTYITADVDNFRDMVQQVTGGGNGQLPVAHVLKPEPQRVVSRLQPGSCFLPTLDTSAFLLDHVAQQQQIVDPTTAVGSVAASTPPPDVEVDGGSCGFDFGSFSGFPTLESFIESNVV
ncbi:PREDICTED: calmodulin-binding protein 25-like [Nicotiana attenuata]|uniref:VQ domain-containing protein n=1 Tax=Nicotiana attenuata TaxID=49451 RepID=A0A1J6I9G4_NICAT|nr:PREDICTED: calmodulin-binding protein 25-like [Nicotiana attenuata]OIT01614.1 hypothetical protein A4A49_56619 [Nicotiana attenuata]